MEPDVAAIVERLEAIQEDSLRALLADPVRTLALLNGWAPDLVIERAGAVAATLAPLSTTTIIQPVPADYVELGLFVRYDAEVPFVIQALLQRDEYVFIVDPAAVSGWNTIPYWGPSSSRSVLQMVNTDLVFTSRARFMFQGFYIRTTLWNILRKLLQRFGERLVERAE